jgi:hypothetical protein
MPKPSPFRVNVHKFAQRHTPASPYSHANMPLAELAELIATADGVVFRDGYRDGVLLARLPARLNQHFRSAVAMIQPNERVWEGTRARREGELPRPFREVVRADKSPAQCVDIVLYRQDLAEIDNPDLDAWEIISINAYPDDEADPPLLPTTIVHNLHDRLLGDPLQPAAFWAETQAELARAVPYWSSRAMIQPPRYLTDTYTTPATPPASPRLVPVGQKGATLRAVWYALGAPNDGPARWCVQLFERYFFITHDNELAFFWSDTDDRAIHFSGYTTLANLIGAQNV